MQIPNGLSAMQQWHIVFGIFLQLQIVLLQRKEDPGMLFACFATKPTLAAALPEPLHILGRPVMGQDKAAIQPCVAVNKKDDTRREALRKAQKSTRECDALSYYFLVGCKILAKAYRKSLCYIYTL